MLLVSMFATRLSLSSLGSLLTNISRYKDQYIVVPRLY